MPVPQAFLHSKRLYLRHLLEEDANGPYLAWFNDDQVCYGNSHHVFPFTKEAAIAYIRESLTNRSDLVLAIIDAGSGTHIGNISLQQIHPVYHSAEFAIVIGDKAFWSKGYGLEAGKLICGHGFSRLNLHRIYCNTFDNNTAMKKLALSLGMAEEGRRKEAAYTQGSYLDVIEYGMTKEDYVATGKSEKKGG
jgi:[ribosomal protein S5]-alanine N-acetyltransferase